MCTIVWVEELEEPWVDTQEALAAVVEPSKWLLHRDEEFEYEPAFCLCHVDVPRTLAAAGYDVRLGWDTHGVDLVATKKAEESK